MSAAIQIFGWISVAMVSYGFIGSMYEIIKDEGGLGMASFIGGSCLSGVIAMSVAYLLSA